MKYLLHLAYNGTNYHGWQRQTNTPVTIQEVLETQISIITQEKITINGCGRTDKGVHAQQYFAHFSCSMDISRFGYKLNKVLPKDIVIYDCLPVGENFNARFAAKKRTYRYYFHTEKNPMLKEISSYYELKEANYTKLTEALNLLLSYKDFKGFCKAPNKLDNTLCDITATNVYSNEQRNRFCLEITSNRFLRGMIRIIVFRLFEVALGKKSIQEFEDILSTGVNKEEIRHAYPQGLYLHRIEYPNIQIEPKKGIEPMLFNPLNKIN